MKIQAKPLYSLQSNISIMLKTKNIIICRQKTIQKLERLEVKKSNLKLVLFKFVSVGVKLFKIYK